MKSTNIVTEIPLLAAYPDVLTFDELCQILRIGRRKCYGILQRNEIKHRRVGKKYVISKAYVLDYIHQNTDT